MHHRTSRDSEPQGVHPPRLTCRLHFLAPIAAAAAAALLPPLLLLVLPRPARILDPLGHPDPPLLVLLPLPFLALPAASRRPLPLWQPDAERLKGGLRPQLLPVRREALWRIVIGWVGLGWVGLGMGERGLRGWDQGGVRE
jgi:hypothetical protein